MGGLKRGRVVVDPRGASQAYIESLLTTLSNFLSVETKTEESREGCIGLTKPKC